VFKNNLDFQEYHKKFLDGYCILPLITKQTKPQYYTNKLTSTINYAKGYNLKCLIDKDLQDIYKLDDVEIFNDINDITISFENTLKTFYETER
jgi:predicted membrane protein